MNDKSIRLRVVVQRNGLPEDRFMLPVSLDEGPTVAKLLDQVNSTYFPLESDQWGLDDYAVYRQASDGTTFECLHFSPIQSLFKDDDQVLVRPLQTDDVRRRRLGGRYQISSDGKHLLDGVPFGRPLLRAPPSRPPIHIPPRKKRRLLYDQDEPIDHGGQEEEGIFPDSHHNGATDGQTSMLLLTNGNAHASEAPDDEDEDEDDENEEASDDDADEEFGGDLSDSSSDLEGEEDLEEELRGLEEENAMQEDDSEDAAAAGSRTRKRRARQSRAKQSPDPDAPQDTISALRAAFPSAPLHVCEKILAASNGDLRDAYLTLCDGFAPVLSEAATLARTGSSGSDHVPATDNSRVHAGPAANATALALARNALGNAAEDEQMDPDGEDEVSAYVRQFDHRGLPPGTISTGKGPSHMAAINGSLASSRVGGDSETTSATLVGSNGSKSSPEKIIDEDKDDETSSSGTNSSSESESSEAGDSDHDDSSSDEASEDDDSIDSDSGSSSGDDGTDSESSGDESSQADPGSNDVQDDEGDSDSADEDESGPEQATTKRGVPNKPQAHMRGRSTERGNAKIVGSSKVISDDTSSSDDTSEEESSESDSSSDSESESPPRKRQRPTSAPVVDRDAPAAATSRIQADVVTSTARPGPVPPGQGKESTKSRNARRRAAQKAKKQAQAEAQAGVSHTGDGSGSSSVAVDQAPSTKQSLFEAKRKALLDAIADGGVEINSKGEQVHDTHATTDAQTGSKRKLSKTEQHAPREQTPQETPISEAASVSTDASQKRRRIDVGAGRRLLFGALGLRNPRGEDEAEKVRVKLMKGVRPHTNPRLEQDGLDPKEAPGGGPEKPTETENPDAWKEVITYRAVECCQEGVELSEPPFPFVQRWDPQQQSSWSHKDPNKRGGQGKRAQRNQAHYYHEDGASGKKRKHDVSFDLNAYDETFNGIEDGPHGADDIQLNYDDVEPSWEANDPVAEASQFTDMEDLPSLPRDLSSLPTLRPGDVQPGMVITWKRWSCSRATNWEPRLSDVTGVVVRIDDDVTGVEVCLAKRDRDLDGIKKQYDPVTGQRVYDKFEAPDLDDDDEDDGAAAEEQDEGYRTLSFAEMQDPRVLQQPLLSEQALPSVEGAKPSENTFESHGAESAALPSPTKAHGDAPSQPSEASHMPESLPVAGLNPDAGEHGRVEADAEPPRPAVEPANVEETQAPSNSTEHQSGQGQRDPALSSMPPMSEVNSPSQQLRETTSQVNDASSFDPSIIESSGYKGDVDTEMVDTAPLLSDSVGPADRSDAPVFDGGEDLIAGTPKVAHPKVVVPSPAGSVRSGRQLDYTMEEDGPESLRVTEADDEAHGASPLLDADNDDGGPATGDEEAEDDDFSATPTPTPAKTAGSATAHQNVTATPSKPPSSRGHSSSPSSVESLNTIFCTARSSRRTQSPSKPQPQPAAATETGNKHHLGYEEAMRKLDEQSADEEDEDEEFPPEIPDSFPQIKKSDDEREDLKAGTDDDDDDDEFPVLPAIRRHRRATIQAKISPPPPKRASRERAAARRPQQPPSSQPPPVVIPPGTQVIDLLSSSSDGEEPEPQFAEDYADEDVDETYAPNKSGSSSLPKGPGWITKPKPKPKPTPWSGSPSLFPSRSAPAAKRGFSASQGHSQSQSQSQGSASMMSFSAPSSSLPEFSARTGARVKKSAHRKTSARF